MPSKVLLVTRGCRYEGTDEVVVAANWPAAQRVVDDMIHKYKGQDIDSLIHWFYEWSEEFPESQPEPTVFVREGPNTWVSRFDVINIREVDVVE